MKGLRATLFGLWLGLSFVVPAQAAPSRDVDCQNAMSQTAINACAHQNAEKADRELNEIYRQVLARHADDPVLLDKLRAAQRLWIQFRDAERDANFPLAENEDPYLIYGSMYPTCISSFNEHITRQRANFLNQWLYGPQGENVCRGSMPAPQDGADHRISAGTACRSGTTDQLNRCAEEALRDADQKLNEVYLDVMAQATPEFAPEAPLDLTAFRDTLRQAQRLWIRLRDADVAAKFPNGAASVTDDPAIAPMCLDQFRAQLTEERSDQLVLWIEGFPQGEMCAPGLISRERQQ